MQKEHFSLPHRTEDFNQFYPRKSELHSCKKKNAKTLCKASQMLKSPVYLKEAHFACVCHTVCIYDVGILYKTPLLGQQKYSIYHLLQVGPREASSSVEMGKFSRCLPAPSQRPGKWSFHLQYRKPLFLFSLRTCSPNFRLSMTLGRTCSDNQMEGNISLHILIDLYF